MSLEDGYCPACSKLFEYEQEGWSTVCPHCNTLLDISMDTFPDGDGGSVLGYVLELPNPKDSPPEKRCPACRSADWTQTTTGYTDGPGLPNPNRVVCNACGWRGCVGELVEPTL